MGGNASIGHIGDEKILDRCDWTLTAGLCILIERALLCPASTAKGVFDANLLE